MMMISIPTSGPFLFPSTSLITPIPAVSVDDLSIYVFFFKLSFLFPLHISGPSLRQTCPPTKSQVYQISAFLSAVLSVRSLL